MSLIADILLIVGALGAAIYCIVVSRRVARLASLEGGMGSAIAVLSAEVDGMTRALAAAQGAAAGSTAQLAELSARAEETARRLELLLASMHDVERQSRATIGRATEGTYGDAVDTGPEESDGANVPNPTNAGVAGNVFLTRRSRLERSA